MPPYIKEGKRRRRPAEGDVARGHEEEQRALVQSCVGGLVPSSFIYGGKGLFLAVCGAPLHSLLLRS